MKSLQLSFNLAAFLLVISAFSLSSCGGGYSYVSLHKTNNEIDALENKVDKVYYMYLGHFSNEAQAQVEESPIYKAQEIITVPIWPKRGGERWLYLTWFQANKPEAILAQEVWYFKRKDPETIEVNIYNIPNPEKYTGDWRKKEPLKDLKPADLIDHGTCETLITKMNDSKFKVKSDKCRRDVSDVIKYVEYDGEITSMNITLYSTMFNAKEKKIFSYDKGIKFVRLPKDNPKY